MEPKSRVENIFELIWGVGLRLLLLAGIGYFLYRVRSVVAAILLAAVLTYAVLPIVDFLCSYRVRGLGRRAQRVIATALVFIVLISMSVSFVVAFFGRFQTELVDLKKNSARYLDQLDTMFSSARKWYVALPKDVQGLIKSQQFGKLGDRITAWSSAVLGKTLEWLSHLLDVVLIPVLAFYFTIDSRTLKREFVALAPRRRTREALAILHEINGIMRSYVIGQIILCAIAAVVVGAVLSLVGMRYVLILSVFAGITRAIPIIGPIVSGVVIVLLAVVKSPILGVNLLIFFALLHFVESKFIMPKLIGDRMQLHPALIIIVLLVGAEFFGIIGMFLAAPVAAILRVLVRYYIIKPKRLRVWGLGAPVSALPEQLVSTERL